MVWPSSADRVCCVLYDISSLPHLGQRRSTWTKEEVRHRSVLVQCKFGFIYTVENRHEYQWSFTLRAQPGGFPSRSKVLVRILL